MAKELPYFKFEPNAWDAGNIQMCSRESKGLFIDICSLYWSRVGELPHALALQKLCNGNASALQELIDHDIIGLVEGQICIEFLDEQLKDRGQISQERRESALKRWNNANAMQVHSKANAKAMLREEKRREENRREENNAPDVLKNFEWFKNQIDEIFMETIRMNHKGKNIEQAIKESYAHMAANPMQLARADPSDVKRLVNTWLSNQKYPHQTGKSNGKPFTTADVFRK